MIQSKLCKNEDLNEEILDDYDDIKEKKENIRHVKRYGRTSVDDYSRADGMQYSIDYEIS